MGTDQIQQEGAINIDMLEDIEHNYYWSLYKHRDVCLME